MFIKELESFHLDDFTSNRVKHTAEALHHIEKIGKKSPKKLIKFELDWILSIIYKKRWSYFIPGFLPVLSNFHTILSELIMGEIISQ